MLVIRTATASTSARFNAPRPQSAPMAAEHQTVAAVFSPRNPTYLLTDNYTGYPFREP